MFLHHHLLIYLFVYDIFDSVKTNQIAIVLPMASFFLSISLIIIYLFILFYFWSTHKVEVGITSQILFDKWIPNKSVRFKLQIQV